MIDRDIMTSAFYDELGKMAFSFNLGTKDTGFKSPGMGSVGKFDQGKKTSAMKDGFEFSDKDGLDVSHDADIIRASKTKLPKDFNQQVANMKYPGQDRATAPKLPSDFNRQVSDFNARQQGSQVSSGNARMSPQR